MEPGTWYITGEPTNQTVLQQVGSIICRAWTALLKCVLLSTTSCGVHRFHYLKSSLNKTFKGQNESVIMHPLQIRPNLNPVCISPTTTLKKTTWKLPNIFQTCEHNELSGTYAVYSKSEEAKLHMRRSVIVQGKGWWGGALEGNMNIRNHMSTHGGQFITIFNLKTVHVLNESHVSWGRWRMQICAAWFI